MFWNMPRSSYRAGQVQMSIYVTVAQRARLKAWMDAWGAGSLSDVVSELIRREVDHGSGGVGPGPRLAVVSDIGGSRVVEERGGEGFTGIQSGAVVDEVTGAVWHPAAVPAYPDAAGDPFGDDDPFASVL